MAQKLVSRDTYVHFFSETPVEDIEASLKDGVGLINTETKEFVFQVNIQSFTFEKALMQEHFNENYMESAKFPKASFRGTVMGWDPDGDAQQEVVAKGKLDMHGVSVAREVTGTMTRTTSGWMIGATFSVPCTDHNIDIPKVVSENIAEVIDVTLTATLLPR